MYKITIARPKILDKRLNVSEKKLVIFGKTLSKTFEKLPFVNKSSTFLFVEKFKSLKLNFNIVPVLLDALIDYGENELHDIHSRLTVTDIDDLSDDDKLFIINNFFDSNYHSMILPNEEYNKK